ncbi:hypothetical protein PROFUN_08937 [Planoprotostelium fungivorum]|uniref:Uncharacterized protein n=1 Tax=Planoprotostelium fungivorum TaxID=1890364 RepID=A0A2P6NIQ6_9EUKA|nr:hypothetical protein PROFUN_08937 [Planoprotostelium fungivorum]
MPVVERPSRDARMNSNNEEDTEEDDTLYSDSYLDHLSDAVCSEEANRTGSVSVGSCVPVLVQIVSRLQGRHVSDAHRLLGLNRYHVHKQIYPKYHRSRPWRCHIEEPSHMVISQTLNRNKETWIPMIGRNAQSRDIRFE